MVIFNSGHHDLRKKKKKYVQKTKGGELSFLNKKSSKNSTFRTKVLALKRRLRESK